MSGYDDNPTRPVRVFGTNGPIGYTDEALSQGPKVIVGRKGAYRGVHLAKGPFWVIDTAYYLTLAPEINPLWAYYALLNANINNLGSGSAIPSTTREDFYALPVVVPGVDEQKAVADVLETLDGKIAANARVVRTADELSRVCFQAATLEGNEVPLSSLATFVNGRAYTKDATGTGRVVVRIAELNSGIGGSTVWNDIEVPDDNTVRPGDLLFAWSGSLTAARWYRPEAIVNQHIFKVTPPQGVPMWLVNQAVHAKLDEFKAIAADKATTMGHIQRRHLDEPVRVPIDDDIKRLNALMTGLWEAALAAEVESLTLTKTRDELLPLLMSGKFRVKEAEKVAEAVL